MSASASTSAKPVRWGVISCGKISHDFVNATIDRTENFQYVACAARSLEDAKAFAKQFNIPKYYGSYEELVADADVEAVYVGSIHTFHSAQSILALKAGKHVLCEKPFAVNTKQVEQSIEAAKHSGKFLMEAMWMKYVPSIRHVHSLLSNNSPIGDVKLVEASFGFHMDPNNARLWQNELGGGAVLDLAVYPISLACLIFSQGGKIAPKVTAAGQLTSAANPIDIHESITLDFGPGKLAVLNATFLATTTNEAIITGDKGYIRLCNSHNGSWHCAQRIAIKGEHDEQEKIQEFIEPASQKQLDNKFNFMHSQLLRHEGEHAVQCIREGKKEATIHTLEESLLVMKIMDEVRKQLGVVYKEDRA